MMLVTSMLVKWPPSSHGLKALPMSLGYEPHDIRLCRLGQSLMTALASVNLRHEVVPGLLRLLVSVHPAASRAQTRAQISFVIILALIRIDDFPAIAFRSGAAKVVRNMQA